MYLHVPLPLLSPSLPSCPYLKEDATRLTAFPNVNFLQHLLGHAPLNSFPLSLPLSRPSAILVPN